MQRQASQTNQPYKSIGIAKRNNKKIIPKTEIYLHIGDYSLSDGQTISVATERHVRERSVTSYSYKLPNGRGTAYRSLRAIENAVKKTVRGESVPQVLTIYCADYRVHGYIFAEPNYLEEDCLRAGGQIYDLLYAYNIKIEIKYHTEQKPYESLDGNIAKDLEVADLFLRIEEESEYLARCILGNLYQEQYGQD